MSGAVKISVIIPTCGRSTLYATLHSVWMHGIAMADEVLVVADGLQPEAKRVVEAFHDRLPTRYEETDPTGCVGAEQRNHGMAIATGTHLMFMDDDDVFVNGAISKGRNAAFYNPDRPVIFRMKSLAKRHPFDNLWQGQILNIGNVSTQMFLIPNVKEKLGRWPSQAASDYEFIRSTVDKYPNKDRDIVWVNDIIAEVR